MSKLFLNILFSILLLLFASATRSASFEGPLQTKNLFPPTISLNPPSFETARIENYISVSLSNSSIFVIRKSKEWDMRLDLEMTELNIRGRKILPYAVELGIDIPFISFDSGFMDGFLSDYHSVFGFENYGRESRPDNDFLYEIRRNGYVIVKGKPGRIGISDVRLSAKKGLSLADPYISLKLDAELPTGDAKRGYGSGNPGTAIAFLVDKEMGDKFFGYCNIGVADPGDLKGYEDVNMKMYSFGGVGLEMDAWKELNLLLQLSFQESPYQRTGISVVDDTAVILTAGARYNTQNMGSYEFSFTEDLNTTGAPDFTATLAYKKSF